MRIKSFLFFIALLIGAQAFATTYIKEVKVIGHKDETAFKNLETALKKAGWQALNKDLNSGCGKKSDYIHLLYKTETSNSGTNYGYITGFYISNTYSTSVTYGGRTYYPVPCQGSDDFVASNGDLNNNDWSYRGSAARSYHSRWLFDISLTIVVNFFNFEPACGR